MSYEAAYDVIILDCCYDASHPGEAILHKHVLADLYARSACGALLVINVIVESDGTIYGAVPVSEGIAEMYELLEASGWTRPRLSPVPRSLGNHVLTAYAGTCTTPPP